MRRRSGVVHFFATLERGGAEMRTLELLRGLGDDAEQHRVVTLAREGGALADELERLGVETIFVRAKSAGFPWSLRRQVGDAAVFHTHLGLIGGPVLALGRLFGIPVRIAHFRSDGAEGARTCRGRVLLRLFRLMVSRFATDIVGVSPGALSSGYSAAWREDGRCRVLLSGLDLEPYGGAGPAGLFQRLLEIPLDSPVVLHVGRDHEAKNRIRALTVFACVVAERPDAHLVFVGRNEAASHGRQVVRATELGIHASVHWLGERDDVPALLRSATVTLMTSTREGLPGAVLESVAAGTPVVASSLAGSVYLAEHFPEEIALLQLSNTDKEWSHEVLAAIAQPRSAERRHMARERMRCSPFDRDRCLRAFLDLWRADGSSVS